MDRFEAYTEDGKPCRACISVEDMMKRGKELAQKKAAAGKIFHFQYFMQALQHQRNLQLMTKQK